MEWAGKKILITGGTSGVGLALVHALHARALVSVCARNAEALRELEGSLGVKGFVCDFGVPSQAAGLLSRLAEEGLAPEVIINNAAIQTDVRLDDPFLDEATVVQEISVNLIAPLLLVRASLLHCPGTLRAVVNINSGLALSPKSTAASYCASKAGLRGFTKALRSQYVSESRGGPALQVFEVFLPLVDTPMTAGRGSGKLSAHEAVEAILRGVAADTEDIYVGKAKALALVHRLSPRLADALMRRMAGKIPK